MSFLVKRHQSLIPLSQDHHLGLVLAQRIKLGRSKSPRSLWPQDRRLQRDRTVEFFDTELVHHFRVEEQVLFPVAEPYFLPDNEIVDLLREQHVRLLGLVDQMREIPESALEGLLLRFADLLENHIRKEERVFFEEAQRKVPEEELLQCGHRIVEYFQRVGKAGSDRCLL